MFIQEHIILFGIGGWSDTFGDYIIGSFIDNTEQGTVRLTQGSNEYGERLEIFYNLKYNAAQYVTNPVDDIDTIILFVFEPR